MRVRFKFKKTMRYKIVKMTEAQIKKYHSCDLCECSQGVFCLYPGECTVKENEYIKKVYK